MDVRLLLLLCAVVAASGCVSSNDTKWDLNEIVISTNEIPDAFELNHQYTANSSDFRNSSIVRRVDRRFVRNTTNRTTVVLSSATVYESEKAAKEVRQNFINRTSNLPFPGSEPEEVYYDGKKTTHIQSIDYAALEETYYIYRRNGSLIYFVGVHDSKYPERLAGLFFEDMRKAE